MRHATATISIPSGLRGWRRNCASIPRRCSPPHSAPTTPASLPPAISGVTLAIHLCRGNNRSHWYAEGGYDAIAERLFHELAVDRFLLEYDDERSGTFEPLRLVPKGKVVVLGLVSTKRPALERKEDLLRRINEAARFLPLEQLAISPQCGFASTMEGNLLTEDEQWAKLQLVVDTAREVWG